MTPTEMILLLVSSEVAIMSSLMVATNYQFRRKLWRKGTIVTKKGTYTFTPHTAKEQEQK